MSIELKEEAQENNAEQYFQMANQLQQECKLDEAIDAYRQAVELEPQIAKYHHGLGEILTKVGELDEAINCYRHAATLNSEFIEPYIDLGKALVKQGLSEQALQVFDFVRDNLEYNPNLLIQISELCIQSNYVDDRIVKNLYIFFEKVLNQSQISAIKNILAHLYIQENHQNDFRNSLFCILSLLYVNANNNLFNKLFLLIDNGIHANHKLDQDLSKTLINLNDFLLRDRKNFSIDRLLLVLYLISSIAGSSQELVSFIRVIFDSNSCLEKKFSVFNSLQNLVRFSVAKRPFLGIKNHTVEGVNHEFIKSLYNFLSLELVRSWHSSLLHTKNSNRMNRKAIKTILFVVRDFSPLYFNTATKLILDYAYSMVKEVQDLKIVILKTYDHYIDASEKIFGSYICNEANIADLMHKYEFDDKLAFQRISLNSAERLPSPNKYFEMLLDKICDLNPDCIVTSEYTLWPLGDALCENFPMIYLPLQNGQNPMFDCHIILKSRSEISNNGIKTDSRIRQHQYLYHPFPCSRNYPLEKLKSNPKDIAIISVGVDIDLRVIQSEWLVYLEKMTAILLKRQNVFWTLVGVKQKNQSNFILLNKHMPNLVRQGKIKLIEFEEDLRALLKVSDIYLLPNFVGGGRGTSLAAWEGLPILVFSGNDADNFLPRECVFNTYNDYFEKLEVLIENAKQREHLSNKVKISFNSTSLQSSIQEFLLFCHEARSSFHMRQNR